MRTMDASTGEGYLYDMKPKSAFSTGNFRGYDDSYGGALDSYAMGDNGQMMKMDGWGMDAANLAMKGFGLYNDMQARDELMKQKEEEMQFGKTKYYQNMAMKLQGYREHMNNKSSEDAYRAAGAYQKFDSSKYNQGNTMYDSKGNVVGDPIKLESGYGVTPQGAASGSAFASPTNVPASPAVQVPRRQAASNTAAGMSNAKPHQPGAQAKKKNDKVVNKVLN